MSRPTHDPRWEEFCAAARVLGVHPQLVEDDGQYDRNGGALLFALYRTGWAVGRGVAERSLSSHCRGVAALRAARKRHGVCRDCGEEPAPGRAKCERCLTRSREESRRHRNRLRGMG